METDSEGEENEEEVVVEVEQQPSSPSLQDKVSARQLQVSHLKLTVVPNWIFF